MIKDIDTRVNEILSESEETENIVDEIKEADEKDDRDDSTQQDDQNANVDQDTENDEEENDNEEDADTEEKEEFEADSFDDFLNKTETKVSVKKEGSEPSPIFGPNDINNHNKYRVTLSNKNGKVSFIYWDSIANTKANRKYDVNDALACFGLDCSAYGDGVSFEDFKSEFGYDETDDDQAQKAYDGCRKNMEKAKKLFDEGQLDELMRLASEH